MMLSQGHHCAFAPPFPALFFFKSQPTAVPRNLEGGGGWGGPFKSKQRCPLRFLRQAVVRCGSLPPLARLRLLIAPTALVLTKEASHENGFLMKTV